VTLRDTWARRANAPSEEGTRAPDTSRASSASGAPGASASAGASSPAGAPSGAGERPELPPEVRARADELEREFGLGAIDAGILARDPGVEGFFRAAAGAGRAGPEAVANWMIHELPSLQGDRALDELPFGPGELAGLAGLLEAGKVSSSAARQVLEVMVEEGGDPAAIVERMKLAQESDPDALVPLVQRVMEAHPDEVAAYRSGKRGLIGFFIGQVMRETRGRANPELTRELFERELEG
jgi:glutaminyl-tRNA synthetase